VRFLQKLAKVSYEKPDRTVFWAWYSQNFGQIQLAVIEFIVQSVEEQW
jgi:hypothetical protein